MIPHKIKRWLLLPYPVAITVCVLAAVLFVPALLYYESHPVLAILAFALMAYSLVVFVLLLLRLWHILRPILRRFPLVRRFWDDRIFRGRIGLYLGGSANFLFIIFYTAQGIRFRSLWYISIATYYLVLLIGKNYLSMKEHQVKDEPSETERTEMERHAYIRIGVLLLCLTIVVSGIGAEAVITGRNYVYHPVFIYGVGAYAFAYLVLTIRNLFFYHRRRSFIWSAAQALNLGAALMGIFAFQTALLAQFGQNDPPAFAGFINSVTSTAIFFIMTGTAIYMMVRGIVTLDQKR